MFFWTKKVVLLDFTVAMSHAVLFLMTDYTKGLASELPNLLIFMRENFSHF